MVPHCNSCECEPETVCGLQKKMLLFVGRCGGIVTMVSAGILVLEYAIKYGLSEWDPIRYHLFMALVITSLTNFALVGIVYFVSFSETLWGLLCGTWYVTSDFFTNILWRNFINIFRRKAVSQSPGTTADDSSSCSSGEAPPLPPKRNVLPRGLNPNPQKSLELGPHSISSTTQSDPTQAGVEQSSSTGIEASPLPELETKPLTKREKFRRKMNSIIKMKPIEEFEEDAMNMGLSHIEIPLSFLLSRSVSFNQTVQEETSFTTSQQVGGQIRSSEDVESKDSSQNIELTSTEVSVPLCGAFYQPRILKVDIHRQENSEQTVPETCVSFEGAVQLAKTPAAEDVPEDQTDSKEISAYVRFSAKFQPIATSEDAGIQRQQMRTERIQGSFPFAGGITQGQISQTGDVKMEQKRNEQTSKSTYIPFPEMKRMASSQGVPSLMAGGQLSEGHVPLSASGQLSQEQVPSSVAGQILGLYVPHSVMKLMSQGHVQPSAAGGLSSQGHAPPSVSGQSSQAQVQSSEAGQISGMYVPYSVVEQMSQGHVPPSAAGGQSSQGSVPPSVSSQSSQEQVQSSAAGQISGMYVPYSVVEQMSQGYVLPSAAAAQSSEQIQSSVAEGQSLGHAQTSVAGQISDIYLPFSVVKKMFKKPVPSLVAKGQSSQLCIPLTSQGHAQVSREQSSSEGHAQVSRIKSSRGYRQVSGAVRQSPAQGHEPLLSAERHKESEVKGAKMKQKKNEQTSARGYFPQSHPGKQSRHSQFQVIVEQPRSEQTSKPLYVQLPDLASKRSASKEREKSEMNICSKSSMGKKDEESEQSPISSDEDSSQPLLQKARSRDGQNLQPHSSKGVSRSPLKCAVSRETAAMEKLPSLHVSRGYSVACEEGSDGSEQSRSFFDQRSVVLDLTHIEVPIRTTKDKEDK